MGKCGARNRRPLNQVRSVDMPHSGPILLVDDDSDYALLLEEALEEAGVHHRVRRVPDGREAMRYLEATHPGGTTEFPALVLLDMNLPGMGGFEVLRWIRRQPQLADMPVVMLTGSEIEQEEPVAHDLGANDYKVKPF